MSPSQQNEILTEILTEVRELRKDIADKATKTDLDTLAKEMRSDFATKETVVLMIEPIKNELAEIKTDRSAAVTKAVSIGGMLLGAISILNSWFHFIH